MGTAESKTMSVRGSAAAKRLAEDPSVPASSSEQRNSTTYFKASLVQVCEGKGETLEPITTYFENEDKIEESYYCVMKGTRFEIVLDLARPSPAGVSFGARVYIDSGDTNCIHTFAGKGGDRAVFDHYIWFGPGETRYTIKGFFADSETSIPFVFGSPQKKHPRNSDDDEDEDLIQARASGCVRIQFARVLKWVPKKAIHCCEQNLADDTKKHTKKKARRILVDTKGNDLLTQPYGDAQNDGRTACAMEAVLSPAALFESRIYYNSFAGYTAQASSGTAMLDPEAFRGLPLEVLKTSDVRRRCLDTFLRACQHGHFEHTEEQRMTEVSQTGHASLPPPSTNSPVSLPTLAVAISTSLSRTASYLVCTGKHHDYGESTTIQIFHSSLTRDDLLVHLDTKVQALHTYFSDRPDLFKLSVVPTKRAIDTDNSNANADTIPTSRWFKKFSNRYNTTTSVSSPADTATQKKKIKKMPTYAVSFAEIHIDLSASD